MARKSQMANHIQRNKFSFSITVCFCFTASEPYAWWKLDLTEECIVTQVLLYPSSAKWSKDVFDIQQLMLQF